ncbi:MAG: hydrogenase/urease maturation nickel metallochaperone HypA [Gemmatimonadota bacterium]
MHELSLALEICRIAEEQVGAAVLPDVLEVGLEVGTESGIEISNLAFCLDTLLGHPPFGRAHATIERTAGDDLRVTYLEVSDDRPTH